MELHPTLTNHWHNKIKNHPFTLLSLMNDSILKCKSSKWISKYDFRTIKITVWKHDILILNFFTDETLIIFINVLVLVPASCQNSKWYGFQWMAQIQTEKHLKNSKLLGKKMVTLVLLTLGSVAYILSHADWMLVLLKLVRKYIQLWNLCRSFYQTRLPEKINIWNLAYLGNFL